MSVIAVAADRNPPAAPASGALLLGVEPARSGLRNSIRARMADAGGHAEIISAPGRGTPVVLTWSPP